MTCILTRIFHVRVVLVRILIILVFVLVLSCRHGNTNCHHWPLVNKWRQDLTQQQGIDRQALLLRKNIFIWNNINGYWPVAPNYNQTSEPEPTDKVESLPQGIEVNVNIPSASDTAWQRAFPNPGALPESCGQFTSKTSSEYR